MKSTHEAAPRTAVDETPSAPTTRASSCARVVGSEGCSACAAPRRYRRRLCRKCWERFSRDGLEMPPRESHEQPVEEYLGRVLAQLSRAQLARAIAIALGSGR